MTTFSQAVAAHQSAEIVRTENGMKAYATTDSKVLNLFGMIGSGRGRDMTGEFAAALSEDENLAVRTLLWARDVRGGAGERATFRKLLRNLEAAQPALAGRLMQKVPALGRWDDLFAYQEPENRNAALALYAEALRAGDQLAAKWAPRETSSKKAVTAGKQEKLRNARDLRRMLGLSAKDYRKLLAATTDVVEQKMCAKKFEEINFSHVPSLAASRYQKAFLKNAKEQYAAYLRELEKPLEERDPKVKINAGAVYPYDVVKSLRQGNTIAANAQFEALPDYVGDAAIFPMVDVSGSMDTPLAGNVSAMDVAVSLGLYLSHNTSSDFKDMFLTFSDRPRIHTLHGILSQKYAQLVRSEWGFSTNLHAAFDELLKVAKQGNVAAENMPTHVLILSDMEFNQCVTYDDRALEMIKRKYREAGYKLPNVIFWNLTSRNTSTPVKMNDKGVALVSGFSPSIMTTVLSADPENFDPYHVMLKTIMSERYDF